MKVRVSPCLCTHGRVVGLFLLLLTLGVSALEQRQKYDINVSPMNANLPCQSPYNCSNTNGRQRQEYGDLLGQDIAPNMYLGFATPEQVQPDNYAHDQIQPEYIQHGGHPGYDQIQHDQSAYTHSELFEVPNYVHEYFEESGGVEALPHKEEGINAIQSALPSLPHLGGTLTTLAIAYALLGVFLWKDKAIGGVQHAETCDPTIPPTLQYINAVPTQVDTSPHANSPLQKSMLDMFYGDSDDSTEVRVPDMSQIGQMCSPDAFFYGMNPRHMMAVEAVKNIFMEQPGGIEVQSMAQALRGSSDLHPTVWYEALMKAVHERGDMGGMLMPGPLDAIPDSFIPSESMEGALWRSGSGRTGRGKGKKKQKCARVDGRVGRDNGIENRLWYWREDLELNSHHWYWHMEYPLMAKVHPDRRGELFYYLHHGLLARYNIERMCNGLERVGPLPTYPGTDLPPYYAHLDDTNSGQARTDRPPHTPLSDVDHSRNKEMPQVVTLAMWSEHGRRIGTDISRGYLITRKGQTGLLPPFEGIDMVGNTLEASDLSVNPDYYGMVGYHNEGHVLISLAVDPNYKHRLPPGPMGDTATALRDPIFYPWHTNVDNLFDIYKKSLGPYQLYGGDHPLVWSGVHVKDIGIIGFGGKQNQVRTFWNERKFDLGPGLAFTRKDRGSHGENKLAVCAKHLDHEEFVYHFDIERGACANTHSGTATVRVFIAPRYDEKGHKFWLSEQRRLFVPLDSFKINLKIGKNVVTRRSEDSSLTIPWRKTLQQLQVQSGKDTTPSCGCGWPHHLLLPKGSPKGTIFDLFVMVTNGDEDIVKDQSEGPEMCGAAHIYCGIQKKKYPDGKPMGYPFDRYPFKVPLGHSLFDKVSNLFGHGYRHVSSIEEYVQAIPNAALTQIKIVHDNGHR